MTISYLSSDPCYILNYGHWFSWSKLETPKSTNFPHETISRLLIYQGNCKKAFWSVATYIMIILSTQSTQTSNSVAASDIVMGVIVAWLFLIWVLQFSVICELLPLGNISLYSGLKATLSFGPVPSGKKLQNGIDSILCCSTCKKMPLMPCH